MPGQQHDPSSGSDDPAPTSSPTPDPTPAPLRLRTPTDLLAALPYLVDRPLDDAVVALVLRQDSVLGVLYGGLDHLDHVLTPDRSGRAAVDAALAEDGSALLVAGFGHSARVTPHVRALLSEARARGLPVLEALRVTGDRFWSYLCHDPGCCPAEGRRFDADASPVPAGAVVRGLVPLGRTPSTRTGFLLEPAHGPARAEAAEAVAAEEAAPHEEAGHVERRTAEVLEALAEEALRRVTDPAVLARLGVHLTRVRVRDAVWTRITPESARIHVRLWSRLVRHLPDRLLPAPAALLAVAAWQHDDLDLARAAVDVALEAEPGYAMAVLMARALKVGLPADRWRGFLAARVTDGDGGEPDPERAHEPRRPSGWLRLAQPPTPAPCVITFHRGGRRDAAARPVGRNVPLPWCCAPRSAPPPDRGCRGGRHDQRCHAPRISNRPRCQTAATGFATG
ncbi:DUF4192 domain-containing protein [Nocardiopsis sp. L17-MgMaSL7]|uniref:DUF4192 domain-containing protein n=1 Tax=Nocardiopsis sp. L17-MgMaSL7 TaxID=1938893 RepID=UPI000D7133A8|nr:DUF4192 domain-containing protein [Nocardiopsis sp. L17-MgMaSL7]PWV57585.1 uncharacterized protein DUF4192 [Nocardiopsis sp. L17-MgMaSL7]